MPPNVCVVVLDAVRSQNLSCYGHTRPTTPEIDDLADDAIRFEDAYAPTGVTIDSVASILSGRYPAEHQSGRVGGVNVDDPLLPELLDDHGYHTGAVTCNPFISPSFGFGRGIEEFHPVTRRFERGLDMRKFFSETKHLPVHQRYLRFLRAALDRDFPYHLGNALQFRFGLFSDADDGARQATRQVTSLFDSVDEPWFLYLHYTEAHMNSAGDLPYSLPADEATRFLDSDPNPERLQTHSGAVDYDSETRDIHERLYDAAVRYLDGHVGRLVDALRERELWEDTLFVVTADHGELIGEHGRLGHGVLYEPSVRIPLLVKLPSDERAGQTVEGRVNIRTLYHAILETIGIDPLHDDVNPLEEVPEYLLTQDYSNTWEWSRYGGGVAGVNALYRDDLKLHVEGDDVTLYELGPDPDETTDVADERPEMVGDLHEELIHRLNSMDIVDDVGTEFDVSEATEQRLSDLGYVE